MSARSRSRPARTCGRSSTSLTSRRSAFPSPCASACRRPAPCSPALASTTRCCRWAVTRSASPAVQGTPIRLVKARTVDAMAIADSELVLEGYVDPRDRRFETKESEDAGVQGRFHFHPEWAGYMGKAYKAPTFHVTAVTMRDPKTKPIIFALGVHTLDDHNIDTTVREAALYELCERLQPGIVQNVVIPY